MKLYVLTIDHKHGRDVSVHQTDLDANEHVLAYCKDWWTKELGADVPMPEDPGQLIAQYFAVVQTRANFESWSVEECDVDWLP